MLHYAFGWVLKYETNFRAYKWDKLQNNEGKIRPRSWRIFCVENICKPFHEWIDIFIYGNAFEYLKGCYLSSYRPFCLNIVNNSIHPWHKLFGFKCLFDFSEAQQNILVESLDNANWKTWKNFWSLVEYFSNFLVRNDFYMLYNITLKSIFCSTYNCNFWEKFLQWKSWKCIFISRKMRIYKSAVKFWTNEVEKMFCFKSNEHKKLANWRWKQEVFIPAIEHDHNLGICWNYSSISNLFPFIKHGKYFPEFVLQWKLFNASEYYTFLC